MPSDRAAQPLSARAPRRRVRRGHSHRHYAGARAARRPRGRSCTGVLQRNSPRHSQPESEPWPIESHKKHIKHMHQHEPATPKAKSPTVKADVAYARIAKTRRRLRGSKRVAAKKAPAKKRRHRPLDCARKATRRSRKKEDRRERKVTAKARSSSRGVEGRVSNATWSADSAGDRA